MESSLKFIQSQNMLKIDVLQRCPKKNLLFEKQFVVHYQHFIPCLKLKFKALSDEENYLSHIYSIASFQYMLN